MIRRKQRRCVLEGVGYNQTLGNKKKSHRVDGTFFYFKLFYDFTVFSIFSAVMSITSSA